MNRSEWEAKHLIEDVQHEVRPVIKVLITQPKRRPIVQVVRHVFPDGRVRTEGGDIWFVKDYNKVFNREEIRYVATR